MNLKNHITVAGLLGFSVLLMLNAMNIPQASAMPGVQQSSTAVQSDENRSFEQKGDTQEGQETKPVLPPTNDPEMVVQPQVPPDPDAVVTPPIVDPEMAVDPASGETLTPEKLERLTPEELEKDRPERQNHGR